ncbi:MAG: YraN family protein [Bacteroidota bacterium]
MTPAGERSKREKGKIGEDAAIEFLKNQGFEILEQNYYYNHGEIDIIAQENGVLVFVEVKSRRSIRFGEPQESVTPKKQELLRRTAEGYVMERNIGEMECRFDVVAVLFTDGGPECTHFKNCF